MNILAVIPARYQSSRFPGKPLADILGKPMIQHVYERTSKVTETVVATDDKRIFTKVNDFGGRVVMTGIHHKSGTDRCFEALNIWEEQRGVSVDIVLNIQGDEPLIEPEQIRELISCFNDPSTMIATLIRKITSHSELINSNIPKVITDNDHHALYFSRTPIPYLRDLPPDQWLKHHTFYKHIGLYGFKKEILQKVTGLPTSSLETAESLEQLRWLQNGFSINTFISSYDNHMVDTPGDLEKIISLLSCTHK
ncbi:MAG: 3-deoxy-manno-octulosonate cytidylyltransferase [Chlorobi bacterium]|nr:3-deoxy-manno-octulosonate cytidylyltransferase [Chlorobiota bacterium]